MAKYASPRSPKQRVPSPRVPSPRVPSPLDQQLPLVSGRWLAWSLLGIFGGGLALVYLTLCFLFWQGQWQILFHPSHTESAWPSSQGLKFEHLAFSSNEVGQSSLDGWFIPADSGGRYADRTILYLHGMDAGSLAETVPQLAEMHGLGINIFAFDYRGFGFSQNARPSEKLASEDTEAAWQYLTGTRHIAPASIVFVGVGLGASLAAEAAALHPEAAGVIVDHPSPTALALFRSDPRSRWMPVRLLAHDRFDPVSALQAAKLPKLFLLPEQSVAGEYYAKLAADPKFIVHLPKSGDTDARTEALKRFIDELP